MSIITTTDHTAIDPNTIDTTGRSPVRSGRPRWPLFGVVAGLAGGAGAMMSISQPVDEADAAKGVAVIDQLERANYHVAFVLGLVSVAALVVTAAAWRRWAETHAPDHLAARLVGAGLAVTAAVNLIGTSMAGSMALYLPGGQDEGWLSREAIFVNYTFLDFGMLLGWWGAVVAAVALAVVAFTTRGALVPRWLGAVSVVLVLPPIGFALVVALPGFPGLVMPLWLVVASTTMALRRPQ